MIASRAAPFIYEINTWTWLHELSRKLGRPVRLDSVPDSEWEQIASLGMDAVWLMGVWERSPEGIRIARFEQGLEPAYRAVLPDYSLDDVSGSPYCIRSYRVDETLGGPEGLAVARRQLARHNLRLVLDFVPNHVAPDHPWVMEHPECFVRGFEGDQNPAEYFQAGGHKIARGRDPYFAPWPDTAQLNAFAPELRDAALTTVDSIAAQCDGVRCDMAMLVLTGIFERTWGARAGNKPPNEYWAHVIAGVRGKHPDFLFIAEAYWDLEWTLQQLGFDYCYDKVLYDRLAHENAEAIRGHLSGDLNYQQHLIRFVENHDEPRAAATFPPGRRKAAALAIATLPGAKLFFHGQAQGRKIHLPVQLGREPIEPVDNQLLEFYKKLFELTKRSCFRIGEWRLCPAEGWPDNRSCRNLLAWVSSSDADRALIVINYSEKRSQGRILVSDPAFRGSEWRLTDAINGQQFDRNGNEMCESGLFVDLEPWQFHALLAEPQV